MKKHEVFKDKVVGDNSGKDWRDAFIENAFIEANIEKVRHLRTDCIKVNECSVLTALAPLMAYVTQFEYGGLWYDEDGLYLTTTGVGSDEEATYEDAKQFLKNWKESRK